jgi:GNAT superfamily N-acetyltransferase
LFDAYRQFYEKPGDLALATRFIDERLVNGESVILLAFDGERAAGFAQLYPSFSSVAARRIFILNDLFVDPAARRKSAGRGLLEAAAHFARAQGAVRLVLSTARTNHAGQALYESLGWKRDEAFYEYTLAL